MPKKDDYEALASRMLKAEIKRAGFTYALLTERLNEIGVEEKEVNIRNKLARGKFSFAFVLKCCEVMEVSTLNL